MIAIHIVTKNWRLSSTPKGATVSVRPGHLKAP